MSVLQAGKRAVPAFAVSCAAVFCVLPAAPVRAQQTAFPVFSAAPPPFAAPSGFVEYATEAAYSLPVSRVRQDAKGNTDSTDAVNLITAVPPFPANGAAPAALWLGTQYGIKHVSGETVRYYLPEEGLPGRYVEAISGDESSAFALVRVSKAQKDWQDRSPDRIAFCLWDKSADTWRVAREINTVLPDRNSSIMRLSYDAYDAMAKMPHEVGERLGKSVLAQSGNVVAFASGVAANDAAAIAYLWDTKTKQVRPVTWEPAVKEKAGGYIGVSFLFVDEARQTLWVGTTQGLLAYDIAKQTGRTVFPEGGECRSGFAR